nr:hypothetical protein CFP56_34784 [Quercus suber]
MEVSPQGLYADVIGKCVHLEVMRLGASCRSVPPCPIFLLIHASDNSTAQSQNGGEGFSCLAGGEAAQASVEVKNRLIINIHSIPPSSIPLRIISSSLAVVMLETDNKTDHGPDPTEVFIYPGYDIWNHKDEADAGSNEKVALTTCRIRHLYDSGCAFFTKTTLQSLHQQLRNVVNIGEKLHVRGLDGTLVEFEIETGRTFPAGDSHLERVL